MGREPRFYISDNVLELVKDLPGDYSRLFAQSSNPVLAFGPSDYEFVQPWQVDSDNHSDVHAEDQDSPYENMDKDVNIHYDVHVEDENSPIIDKDELLTEFDGIKPIVYIIDKRKGKVVTSCLEKDLDLVMDRIAVLEKAFKLRYQYSSEDSAQQVCYKQYELGRSKSQMFAIKLLHPKPMNTPVKVQVLFMQSQDKFFVSQLLQLARSVGFDNMLDPGYKDELADDNDQEGLVKLVDLISMEEHIIGRQPDADWAIVGPYFCPLVMGKDVHFWPANGVKYHVP
nr:hypothetical protein [Tanacetum cinerariifolium]